MTEAIIASIITGCLTLVGTVITTLGSMRKTEQNIRINQAVTEQKLSELTREVREHNNFARRVPVIEEQIKAINHIMEIER